MTLVSPAGIKTLSGMETHAVSLAARAILTPPSGAAVAEPELSRRIVMSAGKPLLKVTDGSMIFNATSVLTTPESS